MTSDERIDLSRCTCGCGKETTADYWHAWQAGRKVGWHGSYGRPYWWMRLLAVAPLRRYRR